MVLHGQFCIIIIIISKSFFFSFIVILFALGCISFIVRKIVFAGSLEKKNGAMQGVDYIAKLL